MTLFPTPISVVIGTFGDKKWAELAERAKESAEKQSMSARDVVHIHGKTLAEARNFGAKKAHGEYLVFLDADDELDYGYIEALTKAIDGTMYRSDFHTFLYKPATLGVVDGLEDREPVMIPERDIATGNHMVIGTAMSRRIFDKSEGFREWPAFEDWDLFWRCQILGAGVEEVPDMIYRVHVNPEGRNNVPPKVARKVFDEIVRDNKRAEEIARKAVEIPR